MNMIHGDRLCLTNQLISILYRYKAPSFPNSLEFPFQLQISVQEKNPYLILGLLLSKEEEVQTSRYFF